MKGYMIQDTFAYARTYDYAKRSALTERHTELYNKIVYLDITKCKNSIMKLEHQLKCEENQLEKCKECIFRNPVKYDHYFNRELYLKELDCDNFYGKDMYKEDDYEGTRYVKCQNSILDKLYCVKQITKVNLESNPFNALVMVEIPEKHLVFSENEFGDITYKIEKLNKISKWIIGYNMIEVEIM